MVSVAALTAPTRTLTRLSMLSLHQVCTSCPRVAENMARLLLSVIERFVENLLATLWIDAEN